MQRPRLPREWRRICFALAGIVVLTTWIVPAAHAQDNDKDRRKKVVGDILQLLIESQNPNQGPGPGPRPGPGPGMKPPGTAVIPPTLKPAPQALQTVRKELGFIMQDSSELANALAQNARQNPALRPLLIDASKLNAQASAVSRQAGQVQDYRLLYQDILGLDQSLTSLTYRITSIPGLPQSITEYAEHLNEHYDVIAAIYGLQNQLDWQALRTQASLLETYLKTLQEDVQWSYGRDPRQSNLLTEGLRVNQAASRFEHSVDHQHDAAEVVTDYKNFATAWTAYQARLAALNNRHLDRSVSRVVGVNEEIHRLLGIPLGLDRQRLEYLARAITQDIGRFCDGVTLSMLMRLPNSDTIPPAADQLSGVCLNLQDCVQRKESDAELVDAYSYVPSAWIGFSQHFRDLRNPQLQSLLGEIEAHIKDLRTTLRIPEGLDRKSAAQIAYRLEKNTEDLTKYVQTWLNRPESRSLPFRNQLPASCASLVRSAHDLEQQLLYNGSPDQLQQSCEKLTREWQSLPGQLRQCASPEQQTIRDLQQRITLDLVELQALLLF